MEAEVSAVGEKEAVAVAAAGAGAGTGTDGEKEEMAAWETGDGAEGSGMVAAAGEW